MLNLDWIIGRMASWFNGTFDDFNESDNSVWDPTEGG